MCIAVFRWSPESDEPLTLAANRDEFFARPTQAMHWWADAPILAGRDLAQGGTWLGITRNGRFALLTNVRNPALRKTSAPSRGELVSQYLRGDGDPLHFLTDLSHRANTYEGFNLLCGEIGSARRLAFLNTGEMAPRALKAGVFAVSNATLDTAWPKVERIKAAFATTQSIESILLDSTQAADDQLPRTGVPLDWERALSSVFIRHPRDEGRTIEYGTRASTLMSVRDGDVGIEEITHANTKVCASRVNFSFAIDAH
jgi:uncharacterized protein with NRDE domain